MKISKEEVLHIATLSRLSFSDEELEKVGCHLDSMLEQFKQLDSVDISDIPPTAHILGMVNVLREDVATDPTDRDTLLANAPETDGESYIVPRVVE